MISKIINIFNYFKKQDQQLIEDNNNSNNIENKKEIIFENNKYKDEYYTLKANVEKLCLETLKKNFRKFMSKPLAKKYPSSLNKSEQNYLKDKTKEIYTLLETVEKIDDILNTLFNVDTINIFNSKNVYIYTTASEHLLFCILYLISSNLINDDINQTNYKEKLHIIYWIKEKEKYFSNSFINESQNSYKFYIEQNYIEKLKKWYQELNYSYFEEWIKELELEQFKPENKYKNNQCVANPPFHYNHCDTFISLIIGNWRHMNIIQKEKIINFLQNNNEFLEILLYDMNLKKIMFFNIQDHNDLKKGINKYNAIWQTILEINR